MAGLKEWLTGLPMIPYNLVVPFISLVMVFSFTEANAFYKPARVYISLRAATDICPGAV